jgi:hypothetical protein
MEIEVGIPIDKKGYSCPQIEITLSASASESYEERCDKDYQRVAKTCRVS